MLHRLAKGLVLVLAGVILLLNTTGFLPWSVWNSALSLWPIVLIALGVQVIFPEKKIPWFLMSLILILVIAGFYSYSTSGQEELWPTWHSAVLIDKEKGTALLKNRKKIEIPIELDLWTVKAYLVAPALELGSEGDSSLSEEDPELAIAGELSWDRYEPIVDVHAPQNDDHHLDVTIKSPVSNGENAGKQVWKLRFNPSLSTDMDVMAGVSEIDLDLGSFYLERFSLSAGVSDVKIRCGTTGLSTEANIVGGVVGIEVDVPEDVGIRISVSGTPLATQVQFDGIDFVKQGSVWVSRNFSAATTKLNLEVTCGCGRISVKKVR